MNFYFLKSFSDSKSNNTLTELFKPIHDYLDMANKPIVLINYIQKNVSKSDRILLNHIPSLFYYSDNYFLYYWCQEDHIWGENGVETLFGDNNIEKVNDILKNKFQIKYIVTSVYKNQFCQIQLTEYLDNYCEVIINDNDYKLYKIK